MDTRQKSDVYFFQTFDKIEVEVVFEVQGGYVC